MPAQDLNIIKIQNYSFEFCERYNMYCSLHIHRNMEIVMVLDGTLHMLIDSAPYAIGAGEAVLFEPFVSHSFSNAEPHHFFVLEHDTEIVPLFTAYLGDHIMTERKITLNDHLLAYCRDMLGHYVEHYSEKTNSDAIFSSAVLMPLYHEFLSKAAFIPGTRQFDNIYLDTLSYISDHLTDDLSLEAISRHLGIRPQTLCRKFLKTAGMTVHDYICRLRVYNACALMKAGNSVTEAAFLVGFSTIRTFNRQFLEIMKITPTDYLRNPDYCKMPLNWDISGIKFRDASIR